MTTEEIAILLRIDWATVNEFTDISEHQRQQLRDATLVRWLLDNFEIVRATLRGVQEPSNERPAPGIVGIAWESTGRREELSVVTELLSDSRYETARDAVFDAVGEFQNAHYRASRNAAEHASTILSELIDELDTAVAGSVGSGAGCSDKARGHLTALRAAADHLVTAGGEALDGHSETANEEAAVARSYIEEAGQYVAPLREELPT
ncbi:hypothetical protein PN417_00445 [Halorubrum ezzemoulense]|uniref:hypothetical protein n=1 Tax=Halorubrum ezzemoulense TaxID=337243 RepID=UPI00232ECFA8|nr:hypothetical protein [Halorubrum ezzemoulense]MDB9299418.1 hypothetical protein [Halorubrum ezzemoulense]